MALFAHDMFDTEGGARPPISMHPAFPAIVALWFAALLGIGSLILPNLLVERLVGATGIGALVPAANPPLGWTAHGLIAAFAAVAGALAGLVIARRVIRAHKASEVWDDQEFTVTRQGPISVRDEIDGDGVINGRGLPVTNRRALAIAEDESAEDVLYTAPLPGEWIEEPVADEFETDDEGLPAEQPVGLAEEHRFARGGGESPSGRAAAFDNDDWKTGSIDGLGMLELAERLGASLQKRREWLAQAKAISEAAAGRIMPSGLDSAAPEDAARATAAYFGGARNLARSRPADVPALPDANADAALRDALATIRRVTGAA